MKRRSARCPDPAGQITARPRPLPAQRVASLGRLVERDPVQGRGSARPREVEGLADVCARHGPRNAVGYSSPSSASRQRTALIAVDDMSALLTASNTPRPTRALDNRRARKTQNLAIIRTAAAELPSVPLADALTVCVVIRERQPDAFERAALRWLARFITERPAIGLEAVGEAVDAFDELR